MAMGVPVIAKRIGGPPDIIRDGVDGMLLPPRHHQLWTQAIRELIGRPDRLDQLGRSGREQAVARFGVDPHVEAVLEAYEHALRPSLDR
jgi:glycosyltransferase involved in cell wall biosynthesis